MNSNLIKKTDQLILKFFNDIIKNNIPEKSSILLKIDNNTQSYFEEPKHGKLTYFKEYNFLDKNELEAAFFEVLNTVDSQIGQSSISDLADIAICLKEIGLDQPVELSSFIYTLY